MDCIRTIHLRLLLLLQLRLPICFVSIQLHCEIYIIQRRMKISLVCISKTLYKLNSTREYCILKSLLCQLLLLIGVCEETRVFSNRVLTTSTCNQMQYSTPALSLSLFDRPYLPLGWDHIRRRIHNV